MAPYQFEIHHEKCWKRLDVELTGISPIADIAVFAPPRHVSPVLPLPASSNGIIYGQDVHFLGFPYGMFAHAGELNRQLPFPLVKRSCLSAIMDDENGARIFLLDGHNNPGFSGGPVVFAESGKRRGESLKVMGVISSFRYAEEPAYHGGAPTPVTFRANTGIIFSYDIKHAIDEIRKNPNGAPIGA